MPTFRKGERPSARKLNALARQAGQGILLPNQFRDGGGTYQRRKPSGLGEFSFLGRILTTSGSAAPFTYTFEQVEQTAAGPGNIAAVAGGITGTMYNDYEECASAILTACLVGAVVQVWARPVAGAIEYRFQEECCCDPPSEDPCTDCAGNTNGATVTITGSCNACCANYQDTYTQVHFIDSGSHCTWFLDGDTYSGALDINYTVATGIWHVALGGFNAPCTSLDFQDLNAAISCVGGNLVGTFTLTAPFGSGCIGCSGTGTLP